VTDVTPAGAVHVPELLNVTVPACASEITAKHEKAHRVRNSTITRWQQDMACRQTGRSVRFRRLPKNVGMAISNRRLQAKISASES
jgi:hypothetical protein